MIVVEYRFRLIKDKNIFIFINYLFGNKYYIYSYVEILLFIEIIIVMNL